MKQMGQDIGYTEVYVENVVKWYMRRFYYESPFLVDKNSSMAYDTSEVIIWIEYL